MLPHYIFFCRETDATYNWSQIDAYHVATAIYAGCDYYISVDKRLLKYQSDEIYLVPPIEIIMETEGE